MVSEGKGIVFHIGYHKTATTWFQKEFYPFGENFTYIPRKVARRVFLSKHAFSFDSKSAKEELIDYIDSNNAIICEEELSGNIHTGGHHGFLAKEAARRIHSAFPESKIVIFIRNQEDIIASTYKQYLKMGGTYGPGKYLRNNDTVPHRRPGFSFDHFKYYDMVSYYSDLFGEEKINVYLFEDFVSDKELFLQKFNSDLGLQVTRSEVDVDKKENPSYQKPLLPLARLLNRFTNRNLGYKRNWFSIPGFYTVSRKLLEILSSIWSSRNSSSGSTAVLGQDNVEYIRNYFRESNSMLSREYGLELSKYNYPLQNSQNKGAELE